MKRSWFTLLELLTIVATIALLAGALLLVLRKSREKERYVNCSGNLTQIGLALLVYSDENSGYFPLTPPGSNFEPLNVAQILNDGRVYGCPAAVNLMTTAHCSNYWYVGSGLTDSMVAAPYVRLAYDQSGNHPENQWMNCLFVDGHVNGAKPDGAKTWNRYP